MSPRLVLLVLLFLFSEAAGIAIGEWFYRLFVSAIPPVGQSQFTASASHVAHLFYGSAVGLALFAWALLGMSVSAIGRARRPATAATPPPVN